MQAAEAGTLCDIIDGGKFSERVAAAGPCDRVLALMLAVDPFQPFKDNAKYSVCPWLVVSVGMRAGRSSHHRLQLQRASHKLHYCLV